MKKTQLAVFFNRKIVCIFILILIFYFLRVYFYKPTVFTYHYQEKSLNLYNRSQDIPHEVWDRVFLSDSDIHINAGYMYILGYSPIYFNFQHPPLLKYFFGLATFLFGNPFYVNIFFGLVLLYLVYFFSYKLFNDFVAAYLAAIFLILDNVFIDLSTSAMLDLGQTFFAYAYLYSFLFNPKKYYQQAIFLALLAASKFWSTALFFFSIYLFTKIFIHRDFSLKILIKKLTISVVIFSLIYFQAFLDLGYKFNLIFFQGKILKYWFHHSTSSIPGSNLILFVTGIFKSWWGERAWIFDNNWSILWPTGLTIVFFRVIKLSKKAINSLHLTLLVPIFYIIYISLQAPFSRYFIIILPFIYIHLAHFILECFKRKLAIK